MGLVGQQWGGGSTTRWWTSAAAARYWLHPVLHSRVLFVSGSGLAVPSVITLCALESKCELNPLQQSRSSWSCNLISVLRLPVCAPGPPPLWPDFPSQINKAHFSIPLWLLFQRRGVSNWMSLTFFQWHFSHFCLKGKENLFLMIYFWLKCIVTKM